MNRSTPIFKTARHQGLGLGYLLKLTILISLLMIGNSHVVGILVKSVVQRLPEFVNDVRLFQFFQIFLPIAMVCVQFWIYDWLKDRRLMSQSISDVK